MIRPLIYSGKFIMGSVTIKLVLKNGNPQSLRTAEVSNWIGMAFAVPRTELGSLQTLKQAKHAGVYLLLAGASSKNGKPKVYIGEAEDVAKRLGQHLAKDFWAQAVAFVSKDETLTKSHFKYLEGRLIEEAKKNGRHDVEKRRQERIKAAGLRQG